jgi:hypothetical protein
MSVCYCDGYGICFGGPKAFDEWFELRFDRNELKEELRLWEEKAQRIEDSRKHSKGGKMPEEAELSIPQLGKNQELKEKIEKLDEELERRRQKAFELGRDPKQRELERLGKVLG